MGPVIAAVNEQPLVAAIVNEDQQEGGETMEARRIIILSCTDFTKVADTSQFTRKGQTMCGFHPSRWDWQRKTQTKVNPQVDKLFSNVRCYSSGNKLLLPTFGTETLRIVLSSADFDLLLDYKCIWFLLTDRWGLEPETGDLRAGQQQVAAAAVTTAVPHGTAVRTFAGQQGESVRTTAEQQGAGVDTLLETGDFRAGQQNAAVTTAGRRGQQFGRSGRKPPLRSGTTKQSSAASLWK